MRIQGQDFGFWEAAFIFTLAFAVVIAVAAAIGAISAFVLAWAWNIFMPAVFGLPHITFWQAFALTFLIGTVKGLFSVKVTKKGDE